MLPAGSTSTQRLADQFGVGIRQRLLGDFPDLRGTMARRLSQTCVEVGAPAGDDAPWALRRVDLLRGRQQFGGGSRPGRPPCER